MLRRAQTDTDFLLLVPMGRIELPTSPLPRECSTTEPHGRYYASTTRTGAGEGNRTLVVSLEGFCSTIELHPHGPLTIPYRSLR